MKVSTASAVSVSSLLVVLTAGSLALSQEGKKGGDHHHILVRPGDIQWAEGPVTLPPGAKVAVIEGNPKDPGLFTMRLKLPAGYRIQPHWHPGTEHVTVISGTFNMGMGDKFDAGSAGALPTGSFAVMPAKTNHFAFTKEETVVQVHGMGPWGITYVNPAYDPQKK